MILRIFLDLGPNIGYKGGRFFKTLTEKGFKFVPSKEGGHIALNLDFVLLLAEINLILKKQSCKKNALVTYDTNRVKIILALLTKIISLYIQALIIQVKIPSF